MGAPGGLRLADETILEEKLCVKQGCVTAFALINDSSNDVKFICDEDLLTGGHPLIYLHPLDNAATVGISPDDFLKFVKSTAHEPVLVSLREWNKLCNVLFIRTCIFLNQNLPHSIQVHYYVDD